MRKTRRCRFFAAAAVCGAVFTRFLHTVCTEIRELSAFVLCIFLMFLCLKLQVWSVKVCYNGSKAGEGVYPAGGGEAHIPIERIRTGG